MNEVIKRAQQQKARVSYYLPVDLIEYISTVAEANNVAIGVAAEALLTEGKKVFQKLV